MVRVSSPVGMGQVSCLHGVWGTVRVFTDRQGAGVVRVLTLGRGQVWCVSSRTGMGKGVVLLSSLHPFSTLLVY